MGWRNNKGIRYPDFIIVKATKNLTDDTILLIVEVKKDCDSKDAARLQMYEYLGMAASKRRAKALQGLLIMGAKSECCHLDSRRESGIHQEKGKTLIDPRLFM
ncbi:hypothetical protein BD779DRAFT_1565781 [Infundibulicybe gibba]|nr:hypothetical protein BD779DRAFT_1565781 [Infundibulicybe gibba]